MRLVRSGLIALTLIGIAATAFRAGFRAAQVALLLLLATVCPPGGTRATPLSSAGTQEA
jgi:hypothetical protein